ncbi:MAG: hypothetical protein RL685_6698 [Pseudomonadota bacterium]|jgi:hypothetical protein
MKRPESQLWQALQGTSFTLEPTLTPEASQQGWAVTLRLESVRELGARGAQAALLPCYSLVFSQQAPECGYAGQGTYRLSHPQLGPQELFVVPLGPSPTARMTYEVILN